eukprot:10655690-Lingulodinium_polyedra.AAC.1
MLLGRLHPAEPPPECHLFPLGFEGGFSCQALKHLQPVVGPSTGHLAPVCTDPGVEDLEQRAARGGAGQEVSS